MRLFSESAESITILKTDMAEAKKRLSSRNKQLPQMWYRSLTLRHILSLLDQIDGVAKVRGILQIVLSCMLFYEMANNLVSQALCCNFMLIKFHFKYITFFFK